MDKECFVLSSERDRAGEQGAHLHLTAWERMDRRLTAGFTTRNGGISEGGLATMNCALHVGDAADNVLENRRRLTAELGMPFESWTCAEQVHASRIAKVGEAERGAGRLNRESALQGTDGLITDRSGILLTAFYADCVPLYFFDPDHHAVGLAHAGWKGTAANVVREAVAAMEEAYGTRPERLLAAIGPSIGDCCYEVDERVMERLEEAFAGAGLSSAEASRISVRKPNGRYMLNLKEANRQFMIKEGILPVHIEITQLCTSCRSEWFFSHRRDAGDAGRMAAWIGFKEVSG